MSTPLPEHLPSAAQPDLFERPLADATAGGIDAVSTPVQPHIWTPPGCRAAHSTAWPHPYASPRPHTSVSASPHANASYRSTYPKVYT